MIPKLALSLRGHSRSGCDGGGSSHSLRGPTPESSIGTMSDFGDEDAVSRCCLASPDSHGWCV